ncbi:Ldh family oxidoreductase [Bordetella genomosp. 13]|uniref:Ldh family oxidoreductase n=1 Tax=Bordetella genomosp. 13 TaxID=463040 RepID=UPI0011A49F13|nr:Ldh family oxidoreductase [Bordetella genomosp. 13]
MEADHRHDQARRETAAIEVSVLVAWAARILAHAGLAPQDAAEASGRLLLADEMGVATHGIARLPVYVEQLRSGALNPQARLDFDPAPPGVLRVRANRMLGQLAALRAIDLACREVGPRQPVVTVTLSAVGHLGALRTHVESAARAGYVAFLCQSTQPVMAGVGAHGPAIGNNPFAFAAPRPDGPPLLIDMAASHVARGNLLVAQREGTPLPDGWAIDATGAPTNDPAAGLAGAVLPAAGHKGLAWAMLVQVLASALTGSQADRLASAGAGAGAYGVVIDPAGFAGRAVYEQTMAQWLDTYRTACGASAHVPGEGAHAARLRAARDGIFLSAALAADLQALGRRLDLSFPYGA